MIQMILGLYLKSLLFSALIVGATCLLLLSSRMIRRAPQTKVERQVLLYDMMMVMIVSIPILAFGILAILMMIQVR